MNNRVLGWIGLCMAAGGVTTGFDLIIGDVRCGKSKLVLLASDASDRTKKQLTDKCSFHNVKCLECEFTGAEIGHAIGKSESAAISFSGRGCFNKIRDYYANAAKEQ